MQNDFSLLPNEIIHDVIDFHGDAMSYSYYELRKLVKIEGSWGEFARELSACTTQSNDCGTVVFRSTEYDCAAGYACEKEIPLEEARNRDICESFVKVKDDSDLDRLTAVAPKLYDVIYFYKLPETHCKALDLMGTRFATITWIGEDAKEPATPELINFIRRQLLSKYLRELDVSGVKFKDGVFDKELVVFVTRPWFEKLCMRDAWCHLPFEGIENAHKAWEAPKYYELNERVISAYISKETLGKIEKYFEFKFEFEYEGMERELNIRHPEESNAKFWLRVAEVNDDYRIRMDISDL